MTINDEFACRAHVIRSLCLGNRRREKVSLAALSRIYDHGINWAIYLFEKKLIAKFEKNPIEEKPVFWTGLVNPMPLSACPSIKPPEPPSAADFLE
jgi:hypothetical protein